MAMEFIRASDGSWWELDRDAMTVHNYAGGYHYINVDQLISAETFLCNSWHELYEAKHYCPYTSTTREHTAWISPDGVVYEASSHEVSAENLLDIIYGVESLWPGDELEKRGWIRVTTSLMWDIRLSEWQGRNLTQKQLDTLWDWCNLHKMTFPYSK